MKWVMVLVCAMLMNQVSVSAAESFEVKKVEYKFTCYEDHPLAQFSALEINGEYYSPVTEMAEFCGQHIEIDKKNPKIILFKAGFSENVEEQRKQNWEFVQKADRKVKVSDYQLYYDDNQVKTELLDVDGCNFIKVKDITDMVGMYMYTDKQNKVIDFTTDTFRGLSQEKKDAYRQYLTKHAMPIDTKEVNNEMLRKSAGLDQYNVVLFGESHGVVKDYEIELYLIKYFNQHENVRDIFSEIGYCDAQLINKYLKTGDISNIETIMNNLKGTFCYSKEQYQFYKDLYEYNKTLPSDKKLEIVGVDIQHQTTTGVEYLVSLLPKEKAPDKIKTEIENLIAEHDEKQYKGEPLIALNESLKANDAIYKEYLGEEYDHFRLGLKNIFQVAECYNGKGDKGYMAIREKKMVENFISQYDVLKPEKCFGIFGYLHTELNAGEDGHYMATYLNTQYERTKGKVATIEGMYYKCSNKDQRTDESMEIHSGVLERVMADVTKSDLTLFPLCKDDSIFVKDGISESKQYLMLIKNSAAATSYDKK